MDKKLWKSVSESGRAERSIVIPAGTPRNEHQLCEGCGIGGWKGDMVPAIHPGSERRDLFLNSGSQYG